MALGGLSGGVYRASAAETPAPNPPIADSCGVDLTLVLDASGSIQSSNAVEKVRGAASEFLFALKDTDSTARVTQFASLAAELAPRTGIDDTALAQNGPLGKAISGYYNPKPPRPNNVNIYSYRGSGSITSSSSFSSANGSNQYTNWDQSLDQAGTEQAATPDLVVYITDGDPTAYDFNQPGDPFDPGPPPDVAVNTNRGAAAAPTIDRAVVEANQIKASSRMLAIGVGTALSNSGSQARLTQISGPQVVRDADLATIDSLNEVDVALVSNFDDLAQFLRSVVLQLCSPSLTIKKLAQSPGNAEYLPAAGWDMTVTPTVKANGGTFTWILPDAAPGASKTVATNADGFAQFQWEPDPPESDSTATVQETLEPGYVAGREPAPGNPPGPGYDYRCEAKDEFGNVREVAGELDTSDPNSPSFTLDPIGQEVVTCTIWNSYDYQPEIALTKVNSPTELRGDLDPPAEVTSTYTVTNPGNTPLSTIVLTDDRCAPVQGTLQGGFNVGDTNSDGLLDPGEAWEYTCAKPISSSASTDPAGTTIPNTAKVSGSDPEGTRVTATAKDDVVAFNPAIELTKLVNGKESDVVASGATVTYTFEATNTGNTPLGSVSLVDVSTPATGCDSPTRGPDAPGNNDSTLDVGETWTYSCTTAIDENTSNTATVTAIPLNPEQGNQPFPDPNPPVTATDTAEVTTIDPELSLTKDVDQSVVFPGTGVTYTYTATNEGDTDLRNDTGNAGWLVDDTCSPVDQVLQGATNFNVGDTNTDDLMNPGETWSFTCAPATIDQRTFNTATIVAQPVVGGTPQGDPLTREAYALVDVVAPAIHVEKTALTPVVLDPDAAPLGPDPADPAGYDYVVTNPGDVPLKDVVLVDDTCSPVDYVDGDANGDGFLDVDEAWTYTCSTELQREQGTPPPTGRESGLVENTATVTGTPFLPGSPSETSPDVTDQDRAQVLVIEPGLRIRKSVTPEIVLAGGEVTYTFEVTNTGDVGLQLIGPADDKCSPLVYVDGDVNGNDLLDGANSAAAETWTFTCTRSIGLPPAPDTTDVNLALVFGLDPLGNLYADVDIAEVRVIDPAIRLEKTVSDQLVPAGTTVEYEFLVSNAGTSPLAADDILAQVTLVDVADPAQPSCESPVLVAKEGGNQDEFLDREPAETWRYACSAEIGEPTVNVAVVGALGGTQFELEVPVFDIAAASVGTFNPSIDIVKSAEPTVLPGTGEVTYTYQVRNTGDVPLSDVADRITDDTCGPVVYASGDDDGDGLLDTPTSIFEDSADETWVFTCTTTVSQTTTNTVEVIGTPVDPGGVELCTPTPAPSGGLGALALPASCDVNATDTATVRVLPPVVLPPGVGSVTITKQTDPAGGEDFLFEFGGEQFALSDGDQRTFEGLRPGAYVARELTTQGWDLVSIDCDDPTGDTTVDASAGSADIVLAPNESVTCTFVNQSQVHWDRARSSSRRSGVCPTPVGPACSSCCPWRQGSWRLGSSCCSPELGAEPGWSDPSATAGLGVPVLVAVVPPAGPSQSVPGVRVPGDRPDPASPAPDRLSQCRPQLAPAHARDDRGARPDLQSGPSGMRDYRVANLRPTRSAAPARISSRPSPAGPMLAPVAASSSSAPPTVPPPAVSSGVSPPSSMPPTTSSAVHVTVFWTTTVFAVGANGAVGAGETNAPPFTE